MILINITVNRYIRFRICDSGTITPTLTSGPGLESVIKVESDSVTRAALGCNGARKAYSYL